MTVVRRECECGADGRNACGFYADGDDGLCDACRSDCPGAPLLDRVRHGATVAAETVDHPAHYGGADDPFEAIKVIESWGLGFHLGNAVKYISRAGRKGDALEDLRKARWYLDREIAKMTP